jgi:tetratricopeptide (TPR) repeat protein
MKNRIRSNPYGISLIFFFWILAISCTSRPFQQQQAQRLYFQGQSLLSQGKTDEAYEKFDQSYQLSEKSDDPTGMAHNLNEKAIIYTARGQYENARKALTQSIEIYKALGMNPEVSKALNNLALTYLREKRFQDSVDRYAVLLEWDRESGNRLGEGIVLNQMGWIYASFLKKPKKAYALYADARDIFKELGKSEHLIIVEKNIDALLKQVSKQN